MPSCRVISTLNTASSAVSSAKVMPRKKSTGKGSRCGLVMGGMAYSTAGSRYRPMRKVSAMPGASGLPKNNLAVQMISNSDTSIASDSI